MKEPRDGHWGIYGSVNPGDVGTVALDANCGSGCGTFIHAKKASRAPREWALRGDAGEQEDAVTGLLPLESLHVGGISGTRQEVPVELSKCVLDALYLSQCKLS